MSVRRLSDKDVRAIFECLHDQKPPPHGLPFRIVPIGSNGLKLSPPSFEFEDGLYVLLRPMSKRKNVEAPQPPPHLRYLLLRDAISEETCPWSLSGPQFPQPTAIQQRYCYPKGRSEYSSQKGGALWTMYIDGKEDTEFRLLHVYYSAKRAVNKGVAAIPPPVNTVAKRLKRTPSRRSSSIASTTVATTFCHSPLPFENFHTASGMGMMSPNHHFLTPSPFHASPVARKSLPATPPPPSSIDFDFADWHSVKCDSFEMGEEDPLAHQLETIKTQLRQTILQAPPHEQGRFVHSIANWAHELSQDPLK